jgi:hypothetical protein
MTLTHMIDDCRQDEKERLERSKQEAEQLAQGYKSQLARAVATQISLDPHTPAAPQPPARPGGGYGQGVRRNMQAQALPATVDESFGEGGADRSQAGSAMGQSVYAASVYGSVWGDGSDYDGRRVMAWKTKVCVCVCV